MGAMCGRPQNQAPPAVRLETQAPLGPSSNDAPLVPTAPGPTLSAEVIANVLSLPQAAVQKVEETLLEWSRASGEGESTVGSLTSRVAQAIPGLAAQVGMLGSHAPLIATAFVGLKLLGDRFREMGETRVAYHAMCTSVKNTTQIFLAVLKQEQGQPVALPNGVQQALNLYFDGLREFSELLAAYKGQHRFERFLGEGSNRKELERLARKLDMAIRDLSTSCSMTTVLGQGRLETKMDTLDAKLTELLSTAKGTRRNADEEPFWDIPPSDVGIIGRAQELTRLDEALLPAKVGEAPTYIVVAGMAGIGKTTLIQHAAKRCAHRFQWGWEVDASSEKNLLARLAAIADLLKASPDTAKLLSEQVPVAPTAPPTAPPSEPRPESDNIQALRETACSLRSLLRHPSAQPWLLIVHAVDSEQLAALADKYLPDSGGCIVVLSAMTGFRPHRKHVAVELGPVTVEHALQFLGFDEKQALQASDEKTAATQVAERMGRLPKALVVTGNRARKSRLSWVEYAKTLESNRSRDTDILADCLRGALEYALQTNKDARPVVEILQLFSPEPDMVPRSLVRLAMKRVQKKADADWLLGHLADYSIIKLSAVGIWVSREMHAIMKACVPCGKLVAIDVYLTLNEMGHDATLINAPSVRKLWAYYRRLKDTDSAYAMLGDALAETGATAAKASAAADKLMRKLSSVLSPKPEALRSISQGLMEIVSQKTARFGGGLSKEPISEQLLAEQEQAEATVKLQYGPDHPEFAKAMRQTGQVLLASGKAGEARPMLETALRVLEAAVGSEHVEVAKTLTSLAAAHLTLNDAAGAQRLLERALAIYSQGSGSDSPGQVTALFFLGRAHLALGDATLAKAKLESALSLVEADHGSHHAELVPILRALADACDTLHDKEGAASLIERAAALEKV